MKKFLHLVVIIGGALVCGAAVVGLYSIDQKKPTVAPVWEKSADNFTVSTRFPAEGSPLLIHWNNGIMFVACPTGFHFEKFPGFDEQNRDRLSCEPNKPPKLSDLP